MKYRYVSRCSERRAKTQFNGDAHFIAIRMMRVGSDLGCTRPGEVWSMLDAEVAAGTRFQLGLRGSDRCLPCALVRLSPQGSDRGLSRLEIADLRAFDDFAWLPRPKTQFHFSSATDPWKTPE